MLVTSPILPDFDDFVEKLKTIWNTRQLTNNGPFVREFEEALAKYLHVPFVSVMANGTLPLMLALKAAGINEGEVITTPYTFVATVSVLKWLGLTPVFADVDPVTGTLSPHEVERMITPRTRAILPVHVYGYPCDVAGFHRLSLRYHLPVIYDAAHAFGVKLDGHSVLEWGDLSTLSFHATKVFNTIEGGAVICHTPEMKHRLDTMRNFGITGETSLDGIGINAKLDELRAAYGLLNLRKVDEAIDARARLWNAYTLALKSVPGLRLPSLADSVDYNYSHYPIYVEAESPRTRDEIFALLKTHDIHPRRYFFPAIHQFETYADVRRSGNLPIASRLSEQVICLPL